MESRTDKYYMDSYGNDTTPTRSSRNSRLYRQVYDKYGDLENLPLADNTDEIDMDKLKELITNLDKKENNISETREHKLDILETKKRNIDEKKVYDINKLLEKAKYENSKLKEPENELHKTSRYILSKLSNEEMSIDNIKSDYSNYAKNMDIKDKSDNDKDNSLSMTREMKYHTRQVSTDPLIEQVMPDNDLAMDLFTDLKPTGNTIVTKPVKDVIKGSEIQKENTGNIETKEVDRDDLEDTSDIDIIKNNNKIDTDFFTSSYKFSDKDFADDEFLDDNKSHNVLKVILLVIAIIIFAGVIFYFVMNYGLGVK